MKTSQKIYIASDFHLGIHSDRQNTDREKKIIRWLDQIKQDASTLILLGDTFDYWFEYKDLIPKGFSRFIGKLAELSDKGIEIIMFTGNHDVWLFSYFQKEINAKVYVDPKIFEWGNKKLLLAHGDGLGPGDYLYKIAKKIFRNRICQWLYKGLPPYIGIGFMKFCSKKSRDIQDGEPFNAYTERLIIYSEDFIKKHKVDYLIFGHRHLPIKYMLSNGNSQYYNCGDWLHHFSYLVFDGDTLQLLFFESDHAHIYGN